MGTHWTPPGGAGLPRRGRASVRGPLAVGLVMASALAGCGPDPSEPFEQPPLLPRQPDLGPAAVRVLDSAGIAVVENSGTGRHGPDLIPITEELVIGGEEEEGPDLFGWVGRVEVLADSTLLVVDGQAREMRVFDMEGSHLLTFGRRGKGPGEFDGIDGVWPENDTVFVFDWGLARLTALAPGGEFLTSWSTLNDDGLSLSLVARLPDGSWIAREPFESGYTEFLEVEEAPGTPLEAPRTPVYRWTPDRPPGDPSTTLLSYRGYAERERAGVSGPMVTRFQRIRFEDPPAWTATPDARLLVADRDHYRLDILDLSGRTLRSIRREVRRVPITPGALDDLVRLWRRVRMAEDRERDPEMSEWELRVRGYQAGRSVREQLDDAPLPTHLTPIAAVEAGDDGSLWIRRGDAVTPAVAMRGMRLPRPPASRWDLFDPEGAFLGTVEFPPRFTPLAFGARTVTGRAEDEFGIHRVVRYRIGLPET